MNPGEQNQNPFRRPGTTTTGSQNGAPVNRSRYFGGRSRYQGNRTSSTNQLNPQGFINPFSQPQQTTTSTPAPAYVSAPEPVKKSHKKRTILIIAGIAAAALLIVVAITTFFTITGDGLRLKGSNHSLSDLQETVEKYHGYFKTAWLRNETIRENGLEFPNYGKAEEEDIKKYEDKNQEYINGLYEFSEKMEQFGSINAVAPYGENYNINEYIETLKDITKKVAVFYDKYIKIQVALNRIVSSDRSSESIENLKKIVDDENLRKLADNIAAKSGNSQENNELYQKVLMNISVDQGKNDSPLLMISRIKKMIPGE